ncbi:helix-turn-helix transcriptional regulator [Pseudomonas thivervalensis]|uniref:helix-turn-helix transcriptional regulator n=1 Tax=Pseudomonas thivervalensis TaxID=86265 RepID=UPI0020A1ACAC|nr:hypothetical protein [Pseudomonas thivervalensis]
MISHTPLSQRFDKSRSGLEELRENDPSFPRPIKFCLSKQAGIYFVVAEVEAWLESKIRDRDGVTLDLAGREDQ